MKKASLIFGLLFLTVTGFAQEEIVVNNAIEFIQAIGPNRTIVLNNGDFKLDEAGTYSNEYVHWTPVFDGVELNIEGAANLKIHGKGKARILAAPRYAWVIMFNDCDNLEMVGVTIGHEEAGYCTGGVLGFNDCQQVTIQKCDLYGSGTEGMYFSYCKEVNVSATAIHDCSYDLLSFNNSSKIKFSACSFLKTGEFDLVTFISSSEIKFVKCMFKQNFNGDFMPYLFNIDESSSAIVLETCKITDNKVTKFVNDLNKITLKKNKFSGNTFKDFTDSFLNKNQK